MSINLQVTYGGAGTGKTYELVNDVKKSKSTSYVILSPTHSSLRNLKDRLTIEQRDHARTVYSYFQIDYENDYVIGPLKIVKDVFIDEFGLIKKKLFKQIINKTSVALHKFISEHRIPDFDITFHIYGDPVQLSPIYTKQRKISFDKLAKYDMQHYYVIEHDYNCLFSLKIVQDAAKHLLTVNHRANDAVIDIVKRLFYDNDLSVITYTNQMEIARLIVNEGYVFISSKYEFHTQIYKLVQSLIISTLTEPYIIKDDLLFYPNSRFLVSETTSQHKNGEYLSFDHIKSNRVYLKDESGSVFEYDSRLKILPEFLITAHKSQGLTIPKVIVCTDNLFDVSMLYTMITRASEDVKFFCINKPDLEDYISRFRDILQFYGYI